MTKEQKFYQALQDVFIGAKIEGQGGFVNLMKIKSNYYRKIEDILKNDIEIALKNYPKFRDELFDKLYSFFSRYFTQSGSIYFNETPFHNNVYEKIYTDDRDVVLFWKTHMLYYVKTDRIFRSLPLEFDGIKFYFDAANIENKKANEKRKLTFSLNKVREDTTIVLDVAYSEKGTKTKSDEILKDVKKKGLMLTEEQLERAIGTFEKQSEVDFFINKNARAFLQEQFKLWSYQYFWDGAQEWSPDRVNQLQVLKDIAFKIIDFVAQFEDELLKVWNKPKFVKNSNYVISLDRINNKDLITRIFKHRGFTAQIKEWKELGIDKENTRAPIDTTYFKDLEMEILNQFDNLDQSLDGWLIKSENYQALNTILPKFKEKVQTIYIDPPFNTDSSPIIYINRYKDSSWLAMMENRLNLSKYFLNDGGINVTAIDDVELRYLTLLLDDVFKKDNYISTIASEANPQGRVENKISHTSEYHIIHAKNIETINKLFIKKYEVKKPSPLKRTGTNSRREERPNRYYPILIKDKKIFMISIEEYQKIFDRDTSTFNDDYVNKLKKKYSKAGYTFILPTGENGENFVWQRTFERVSAEKDTYLINNETIYTPVFEMEIPKTLWKHPFYSNPEYGSEYLSNMLGHSRFQTPKSYYTIMQFITMTGNSAGIYLDYFGGAATTAQAVLELNKLDEEEGQRKYVIIEMGDHFYDVILPRMKKLCMSSKWKKAKPQDSNGISQFFKYYELEQYEEALANCKYQDSDLFTSPSKKPYEEYVFMKDEKMLKALEIDSKKGEINVNLDKLYSNVDIPETLSNLTGNWIKRIKQDEVEFENGRKINIKNLDYRLIKPLIWWE